MAVSMLLKQQDRTAWALVGFESGWRSCFATTADPRTRGRRCLVDPLSAAAQGRRGAQHV